jgi:endoglucanase
MILLKKTFIRTIFLVGSLFVCTNINAQQISKIETAANNVWVVHLETDWINIKDVNRITVYDDIKPTLTGWTVNGTAPDDVGIYSNVYDEKKAIQISNETYFPMKMNHKIYLIMNADLLEGQSYLFMSPYGDTTIAFEQAQIYCESVKVNQTGYALNSNVRYSNFGVFMGDKGPLQLQTLPDFFLKDSATNATVTNGTFTYWGDDTGNDKAQTGEHVYRIDLTGLSEGTYYIEIEGMGRSHYFGVGYPYSRTIAAVHMRGMYHQRCGIALEQPYTNYERGTCHEQVAFTQYPGNGNEGQGWIVVPQNAQMYPIQGGYHDAADYDRRVFHTKIPLLMLNYYEAFQDHFIDDQYNIPESGNSIPDFLDETLWGIKIWEGLQLDSTNSTNPSEYGGVMGGTETSQHPGYGKDRADWENNGTQVYGTYAIYESTTYASTGFFAQASRMIAPYDAQRAAELMQRAQLAWAYCESQSFDTRKGFKMYAALQMYLATATGNASTDMNNPYHIIFRDLAQTYIVNGGTWPYQYIAGNSAAYITTSHFISYLINSVAQDTALATNLYQKIKTGADSGGYMQWLPANYPYAQGVTKFIGWGAATAQGRYADAAAFMYRLSQDPQEKQGYYDLVSQLGDYSLGLNPLSQCYVTGLGEKQVLSPAHLDSYWTKYGETPQGGTQAIIGNVPGIVVFGFTEGRSGATYQTAVSDFLYPMWDSLPGQRRWTDGWSLINSNEFSTWETMVWNACMYSVLYSAQEDPTLSTTEHAIHETIHTLSVFPNPATNKLNLIADFGTGLVKGSIYNTSGRQLIQFENYVGPSSKSVIVSDIKELSAGIYFIHIKGRNGMFRGKFIKNQ